MGIIASLIRAVLQALLGWVSARLDAKRGLEAEKQAAVSAAETETNKAIAEIVDEQRKASALGGDDDGDLAVRLRNRAKSDRARHPG